MWRPHHRPVLPASSLASSSGRPHCSYCRHLHSQAETEARKVLGPARGHAVCDGAGTRTRASQVPGRIRRPLSRREAELPPCPPRPRGAAVRLGSLRRGDRQVQAQVFVGGDCSAGTGLSDAEEREVQALKRVQRTTASTLARGRQPGGPPGASLSRWALGARGQEPTLCPFAFGIQPPRPQAWGLGLIRAGTRTRSARGTSRAEAASVSGR